MKGIILTQVQKDLIQGQKYTQECFFDCVQDINNDWFLLLSENDKILLQHSEYSFILYFSESEFIPKPLENNFFN